MHQGDAIKAVATPTRYDREAHHVLPPRCGSLTIRYPRMLRDLHSQGVAHLAVRVRDGTGLVGPLVVPGVTSCLGCADLHRRDRDAAWPAVAAQLRDTVGVADRATLLATA